ncbi:MAG TPA: peptidylprolyl isomerase [Polyangiaceae bacterium]|jgi:hypothetical protein|nr:peptidylprolyl isomerase [Polyangiaceae bacterium]
MRPFASLALGPLLSLAACTDLTVPATHHPKLVESTTAPAPEQQPAAAKADAPAANAPAQAAQAAPPPGEMINTSHILIAYKGAMRTQATRSKDEAQKLAQKIDADAKAGKNFAELAKQYSDDKGSGAQGGALGPVDTGHVVQPFGDALKALKPGEISGVVESPFGFHVILRSP